MTHSQKSFECIYFFQVFLLHKVTIQRTFERTVTGFVEWKQRVQGVRVCPSKTATTLPAATEKIRIAWSPCDVANSCVMCVCVRARVCVCVCVCVCVACACASACVYMCICICTYTCNCMCVCVCVSIIHGSRHVSYVAYEK